MIEVNNLVAKYGDFQLNEINLLISDGECLVLVGPTGAGKTLFLETLLGIKPPHKGQIFLNGKNITLISPEERDFSYLPQDLALFPHLNIKDNIGFGLKIKGFSIRDGEDKILSTAKMLKIDHLLHRKNIRSLSGGEKQRVALARAIAIDSKILFLDEPFGALDTATRYELLKELKTLQKQLGVTVILVTHDLNEAILLANKMAVIINGKIKQFGTPENVYEYPNNVSVAKFLMVENILPVEEIKPNKNQKVFECKIGDVRVFVSSEMPVNHEYGKLYLGIRARYVDIQTQPSNQNTNNNCYKGVVENVSGPPSSRKIQVKIESRNTIFIECGSIEDEASFYPGQQIFIHLPQSHLFFIREDD